MRIAESKIHDVKRCWLCIEKAHRDPRDFG